MKFNLKQEGKFKYIEEGEGMPIILLHGLMGGLSNFSAVIKFFKNKGYRVLMPSLPIYDMPIMESSVKSLAEFLYEFIKAFRPFVFLRTYGTCSQISVTLSVE